MTDYLIVWKHNITGKIENYIYTCENKLYLGEIKEEISENYNTHYSKIIILNIIKLG